MPPGVSCGPQSTSQCTPCRPHKPHTTVVCILSPHQIFSGFLYPIVILAATLSFSYFLIGYFSDGSHLLTVPIIRTIRVSRLLLKSISRKFRIVLQDETRLRMFDFRERIEFQSCPCSTRFAQCLRHPSKWQHQYEFRVT